MILAIKKFLQSELAVKLLSIFPFGKERNVVSIRREKKAVFLLDNARPKLTINEKGLVIKKAIVLSIKLFYRKYYFHLKHGEKTNKPFYYKNIDYKPETYLLNFQTVYILCNTI